MSHNESNVSSPPRNPVYARRIDPSAIAFSLSLHRHSYINILFRYKISICLFIITKFVQLLTLNLNGHLHYTVDIDRTLNEATADIFLQDRADYNNRPSHAISFMSAIASIAGRIHCEFFHLLFLQAHRETFSCSFRSSPSAINLSLSPRDVLLTV